MGTSRTMVFMAMWTSESFAGGPLSATEILVPAVAQCGDYVTTPDGLQDIPDAEFSWPNSNAGHIYRHCKLLHGSRIRRFQRALVSRYCTTGCRSPRKWGAGVWRVVVDSRAEAGRSAAGALSAGCHQPGHSARQSP